MPTGIKISEIANKVDTMAQAHDLHTLGVDGNGASADVALGDILEGKADKDGYYSTLTAGAAENLVGSEKVEAVYAKRTTGGTADVGTGRAAINSINGNSVVMTQIVGNGNFSSESSWVASKTSGDVSQIELEYSPDGLPNTIRVRPTARYGRVYRGGTREKFVEGHKYLYTLYIKNAQTDISCYIACHESIFCRKDFTTSDTKEGWQRVDIIDTCPYTPQSGEYTNILAVYASADKEYSDMYIRNVQLFDLTRMFGFGYEPTAEEFHRMFPLDYYNVVSNGFIVNNAVTAIRTTGFNLYDSTTGKASVLAFHRYQITGSITSAAYANGEAVTLDSDSTFTAIMSGDITISGGSEGSTCVHLVWSGYRNGDYEPHWAEETAIPVTQLTGKLNGSGSSVTVFPDGMKQVGDFYDEIVGNYAIKRIKKFNLYEYASFTYSSDKNTLYTDNVSDCKRKGSGHTTPLSVCSKYNLFIRKSNNVWSTPPYNVDYAAGAGDYSSRTPINLVHGQSGRKFYFRDESWTSKSTAVDSLSGVDFYYVLDTPEVYLLDQEVPQSYRVDDFGMEEMLPASAATPTSAPARFSVSYAMNAADRLRRLNQTMISVESFSAFCTELASKLGAELNKNVTITPTYNAETDKYSYDISITNVNNE